MTVKLPETATGLAARNVVDPVNALYCKRNMFHLFNEGETTARILDFWKFYDTRFVVNDHNPARFLALVQFLGQAIAVRMW